MVSKHGNIYTGTFCAIDALLIGVALYMAASASNKRSKVVCAGIALVNMMWLVSAFTFLAVAK